MSGAHSDQATQRFQLPVRAPLRELVIACLSALVGSLEIVAWAAFNLPPFVVHAGGALVALGLAIGIWCLARLRATRWTLHINPDSLTIARGSKRQQMPWAEISAVQVVGSRLLIYGHHSRPTHTLKLSPGTPGAAYLADMLAAIDQRLMHLRHG